ncbi:M16 family metallopeptidase [Sphingobacterium psychroaquaticum]|uniref:Predicted Zn-dependent peptidase n=1 Tax=Sphingobacterium psychroaquaticum TaxID=561061 RepID=A0A1X7IPB0_9SPHI|nr:pitrilysin family protein [Sphingobacterium psychroaquaticum]SMG16591.1 Predicted Zn-dependent peptidase [Sphingobacterium psychroaquaticum]
MLNRKEAPAQHPIEDITLIHPEELTFDNGLKVFVFRSDDQELIKAEFIFQNLFASPENPLLNTCLSSMLKEGTELRTSAQIAEDIDFYGAYLVPEYSYDHTALTLYSLRKYFADVVPVAQDVLKNSIIPEAELVTFVRNNKQTLQVSMRKNDYVARKLFYNHIFGETRYGVTPSEENYNSLNREDLFALYRKQIQPQNCTLILSGGVTEDVLAVIRDLFVTDWDNNDTLTLSTVPEVPAFEPKEFVEEREDALQSALRLGMPCVNRTHVDFPALQFVNTLFGGYFGSRLMRNIREEKGYTYSIGSAIASLQHGGFFTIASEVGVEVTQNTLDEIKKEFDVLRQELAPNEEVELVRNYILGSALGSLESIFSHADKFKSVYFYGLDLDYYKRYNKVIRNMTAEHVQEIALQYFDFEKMLKVVVGKK